MILFWKKTPLQLLKFAEVFERAFLQQHARVNSFSQSEKAITREQNVIDFGRYFIYGSHFMNRYASDMFGSGLNIKHFGWIFFGSFVVSLRKCSFVRKIQTSKISLEIHYNRLNHWANIFICCSFQIVSFIVKAKVFSGKYSNVARAAQEKRKFQTLN